MFVIGTCFIPPSCTISKVNNFVCHDSIITKCYAENSFWFGSCINNGSLKLHMAKDDKTKGKIFDYRNESVMFKRTRIIQSLLKYFFNY